MVMVPFFLKLIRYPGKYPHYSWRDNDRQTRSEPLSFHQNTSRRDAQESEKSAPDLRSYKIQDRNQASDSIPRASVSSLQYCWHDKVSYNHTFNGALHTSSSSKNNTAQKWKIPEAHFYLEIPVKAYQCDAFCHIARILRTLMRERPLRRRAKVRYGSPSRHGRSSPHSIQAV